MTYVHTTLVFAPAREVGGNQIAAESKDDYDLVVRKFTDYCIPRKNVIYERFKFNARNQAEGESIDAYVTDLRLKGSSCEYRDFLEELIRDRLVIGILDKRLKEKMLRDRELTLTTAVAICKAAETAHEQMKVLNPVETESVGAVNQSQHRNTPRGGRPVGAHASDDTKTTTRPREYECRKCGTRHVFRDCPAWTYKCKNCSKKGH